MPNVCPTCGREMGGVERRRVLPRWVQSIRPTIIWLLRAWRQAWRDSRPEPWEEPAQEPPPPLPEIKVIRCGQSIPADWDEQLRERDRRAR